MRLYHPLEAEAMRKVVKKVGKQAKKETLQKEMWAALKEVRLELLHGPQGNKEEI